MKQFLMLLLFCAAAAAQYPVPGGAAAGGRGAPNATFVWTGSSATGDIPHEFSAESAAKAVIACYDPSGGLLVGWTRSDPNATTIRVTFGSAQAAGTRCSANATGTGATGATGSTGATGPAGLSVLNGGEAPDNGTGGNGDFYLRTSNACLYGPKAAGAWPGTCVSLTNVQGGDGILILNGNEVHVNSAIDMVRQVSASPPSGACTPGRNFWLQTTTKRLSFCSAADQWAFVGGLSIGTTAPANCTVGDLFFDSDATAGENLFGCTATNTWTLLGDGVGGGGTDYIANPDFLDEFDAGNTASGTVGRLNWTVGGGTTSRVTAESGVPGIVRRATGTTNNTNALTYNPSAIGAGILPAESFDITMRIRLNQTDANTNFRAGLQCDTSLLSNVPPNNGIYFEKLETDTNWFGVTRASSSSTRTDTSQAASTSWVKLRIRRVNGTTIGFTVNSTSEVTATATIPTAACVYWMVITNSTTADKTFDVDYFRNQISGLTR